MMVRGDETEEVTETVAVDALVGSAALVAVTTTLVVLETVGAVNRPVLETVPAVVDHFTAVLLVPCTVALNCCWPAELRLTVKGDTATLIPVPDTTGGGVVVPCNGLTVR